VTTSDPTRPAAPSAPSAGPAAAEAVPAVTHRIGPLVYAAGLAFSTYQVYTAAYAPLSSLVMRSIHVGFLLLLVFALYDARGRMRPNGHPMGWAIGLVGITLSLYHWFFEGEIILRSGDPALQDLIVGGIMILLVFEAARRVMGLALPAICGVFILYALYGRNLPGLLAHRGYGPDQVIDQLFLGTEGIFGIPTLVSSTYIFLFILFGAFLERAGMIKLFNDVSLGTVGHTRGGPGKVAVVSSALMGTINGSGVANVVTTGQFTIPLMKRFGFRSEFAGAVEATASMGGQIMPPVMGAVAFIMAETLNMPYVAIVQAAALPAILYFATVFWMVHLEAGRVGLMGLPRAECPSALKALAEGWPLLLPLAALVYLLFSGYTPLFAGTVALGLTALLVLGLPISAAIGVTAWRWLFWIVLGLACASFFEYGITAVFVLIAVLVALNFPTRNGRASLRAALDSLAEGAVGAIPVGIACALVGVIIGVMTLTGLATSFGQVILRTAETSLFLSLVLTMLTCLVLGMGIPTIPNYIITSSLVGPSLLDLGVPLLVSHMFVFYFGIMADLTPPVALAAFAASSIAKASGMRIGLQCMRIAIAGFVVPFMAVYAPALMLQSDSWLASAYVFCKALIAIALWGGASIGYFFAPLAWWQRLLATAAAFLLVVALPITDEIGFALALLFVATDWLKRRRRAAAAAT
jgi:TRAP transporter 4TM/12TM fusion protein